MKLQPCLDPSGGPVSFETLMQLERINGVTFRSMTEAFNPTPAMEGARTKPRAYGGHVYAQSAWAAAQTVGKGFIVSSVSGFFILMGNAEIPFVYTVRTVRDGRSFCVRAVDVTQEEEGGVCFTCICSFKSADAPLLEFQERLDVGREFECVLGGQGPGEYMSATARVGTWYPNSLGNIARSPFPGLHCTQPDMAPYNDPRPPTQRRQLTFYSAIGRLPPVSEEPNLHVAAHLYASDRNSLFIVPRHWDMGDNFSVRIASLNHTVVFHSGGQLLDMARADEQGREGGGKWFVQEAWTDRVADARTTHHSRIWDGEGRHVATTLQDGMLRLQFKDGEELEGLKERWDMRKVGEKARI